MLWKEASLIESDLAETRKRQVDLKKQSVHWVLLAADTLRAAARDYLAFRNEPWKRAYRKY
jgi:hypothetical protein